jgi:hypothetical protein
LLQNFDKKLHQENAISRLFFTSNAFTKTALQNVVAKQGRNKNTFCQFHQHFTKNIYPNYLLQKTHTVPKYKRKTLDEVKSNNTCHFFAT